MEETWTVPRASKSVWCLLVSLAHNKSAETVACGILNHIICPYITAKVLVSDNNTELINQIFDALCQQLQIKTCTVHPYRPRANGLLAYTYGFSQLPI